MEIGCIRVFRPLPEGHREVFVASKLLQHPGASGDQRSPLCSVAKSLISFKLSNSTSFLLTLGSLLIVGILKFAMVATPLFAVPHCAGTAFSVREAGLKVFKEDIVIVLVESLQLRMSQRRKCCVAICTWGSLQLDC